MLVIGITDIFFGNSLMSVLGVGSSFFSHNTSILVDRCRSFRSRRYKQNFSSERHSFKSSKPSTVNSHFVHVKTEYKGLKIEQLLYSIEILSHVCNFEPSRNLQPKSYQFYKQPQVADIVFSCLGLQGSGQRVSRRSISF